MMTRLPSNLDQLADIYCPPETKQKLMEAAITCVKRWGMDKTSLNDIAKEAGCARQTVYNYYKNKDDLIFVALLESGDMFARKLIAHVRTFATPAERILEGIIYCLLQLPNEPYLELLSDNRISPLINPEAFNSAICMGLINQCADVCLEDASAALQANSTEIAETMTRIVLSLIAIPGPQVRDEQQLRDYVNKRFIPGLIAA